MKIVLFLIDTLQVGGAEKSLTLLAEKLERFKPIFVSIYKIEEGIATVPINSGIQIYNLEVTGKYNFQKAVEGLIPLYKTIQPDVVHSTLFRSDIISRRMKSLFPEIPLINSFVNNTYSKDRYNLLPLSQKWKLKLIEKYDAWTSNKVDLFISNSKTIKNINQSILKIDPGKVRVIFRGRKTSIPDFSKEQKTKIKEEFKFDGNIILNISRLLDRKGQMDLINSFPVVLNEHPQSILLIAGEGPYRNKLENRIKDLKLYNNIFLLGNRLDIYELQSISDIFVFPSYYEGLPGVLIEAMLAGTPIICSDISENQEVVDNETALFFEKGDVSGITRSIIFGLHNKKVLKNQAVLAFEKARNKFNVDIIVEDLQKVYLDLIEQYDKN